MTMKLFLLKNLRKGSRLRENSTVIRSYVVFATSLGKLNPKGVVNMVCLPCFADCIHASDGDCMMNVIGNDRLGEVECACEFYRQRKQPQETEGLT